MSNYTIYVCRNLFTLAPKRDASLSKKQKKLRDFYEQIVVYFADWDWDQGLGMCSYLQGVNTHLCPVWLCNFSDGLAKLPFIVAWVSYSKITMVLVKCIHFSALDNVS